MDSANPPITGQSSGSQSFDPTQDSLQNQQTGSNQSFQPTPPAPPAPPAFDPAQFQDDSQIVSPVAQPLPEPTPAVQQQAPQSEVQPQPATSVQDSYQVPIQPVQPVAQQPQAPAPAQDLYQAPMQPAQPTPPDAQPSQPVQDPFAVPYQTPMQPAQPVAQQPQATAQVQDPYQVPMQPAQPVAPQPQAQPQAAVPVQDPFAVPYQVPAQPAQPVAQPSQPQATAPLQDPFAVPYQAPAQPVQPVAQPPQPQAAPPVQDPFANPYQPGSGHTGGDASVFPPLPPTGQSGGAQQDEEDKTPANFQVGKDLPEVLSVPVPEHSLNFDERYFMRLLAGSISLSKSEKKRIIDSIPKLRQAQIDELINIFEDEKEKFAELPKKHTTELERLSKQHLEDWLDIEAEYKAQDQKQEEDQQADEIRKSLGL